METERLIKTQLVDCINEAEGTTFPLSIMNKMHSTQAELERNVSINIKREIFRFLDLPLFHARNEPIAICGGGPSLDDHIEEIKKFAQVMTCGSAHDHVVKCGITPTFACAVDAMEDSKDYFKHPQEKTTFLLASQCHPSLFDQLDGHKIAMWHFLGQVDKQEVFNGERQIGWGCMIGVLAIQLALSLGFQHQHFFGFDGNHRGKKHHAYDVGHHADLILERGIMPVSVNGRQFHTTTALIGQMENIFDIFRSSDGPYLKGYVHGDGLWAEVIKASPPEMSQWLEAV
jgi:hypothetical protein